MDLQPILKDFEKNLDAHTRKLGGMGNFVRVEDVKGIVNSFLEHLFGKANQSVKSVQMPVNIYKNKGTTEQMKQDFSQPVPIVAIDKDGKPMIEYTKNKGILVWNEGIEKPLAEYPFKGMPQPQQTFANNIVKKTILELCRILTLPIFCLAPLIFIFMPRKSKINLLNKALKSLNDITFRTIEIFLLEEDYLTPLAKTMQRFTRRFLTYLGLNESEANRFAETVGFILEYDNAYRFRLQDMFNETTKDKIINYPEQEIKRIVCISRQREAGKVLNDKFKLFANLITWVLKDNWIKKSYIQAMKETNFDDMKMDESDIFWTNFWEGYDFRGLTLEQRQKEVKTLSKPKFTIIQPQ